ncbi:hypothetical protein [Gloeocapsa sp. PCC 73106]|uniref:hypothetical protein n=1 Tax=Gloeocapsa sp. PCC 73106 TaxID=102232 RepID=UPI0002ACA991|nr:hypothetical protein [Gloeocapsa sp. PCC 73106]ELR97220.1 hypothetical protein GLO73106DRAFT_00010260 [Gloeocapsa sp. PCC 73106]
MSTNYAQPPLEFIPPSFNPLVVKSLQTVLPWWLKFQTNITKIEATGVETLVNIYQEFERNEVRFLMAFRHPQTNDPYCMAYLIWKLVAPKLKTSRDLAHFHSIYDRGIPLWAGAWVGWLYANLGGTSIQRGKMDWAGLRSARQLFLDGQFPLAAAPEGATNGHNELISPLEPGIPQLSFWCAEDIAKAQRKEKVLVVPIGIQYYYEDPPWEAIASLLSRLEQDCGLVVTAQENPTTEELYQRLYNLGLYLLEIMENFYHKFYHQQFQATEDSLEAKLPQLLDVALGVAESYFAIEAKGSLTDRCRRLEQAGWDYIYREELREKEKLSAVELGLADLVAEEANLRMWHMRLAETFVAVTGHYVKEKPTVERFAETLLLMSDVVTRIKNGNPFQRPKLGKQRVEMRVGEPISVSDRLSKYQTSRRQGILNLTQDLQTALTGLIF